MRFKSSFLFECRGERIIFFILPINYNFVKEHWIFEKKKLGTLIVEKDIVNGEIIEHNKE